MLKSQMAMSERAMPTSWTAFNRSRKMTTASAMVVSG
jgi:hypothetical protein